MQPLSARGARKDKDLLVMSPAVARKESAPTRKLGSSSSSGALPTVSPAELHTAVTEKLTAVTNSNANGAGGSGAGASGLASPRSP